MIRVAIVDDQRVVRDGLTLLVGLLEGIEVVGTARDGEEAMALVGREHPGVVMMDLRMPRMDGVQATHAIRGGWPDVQVLVLTTYADDDSLFPALQAGARGYLTKDASAEEIERALRAVAAGQTHLDPAVQQRLIDATLQARPGNPGAPRTAAGPIADELTAREREVLALIGQGLSNGEIAERLVVSAATVKTHVNRVFAKTGVRDRAQAVRYAIDHHIV